jgi:hypothetical protein
MCEIGRRVLHAVYQKEQSPAPRFAVMFELNGHGLKVSRGPPEKRMRPDSGTLRRDPKSYTLKGFAIE